MARRKGQAFFRYGAAVVVLAMVVVAAAALLIPTDRRMGRRPGWDVMPDTWFARPVRRDPSEWKRLGPRLTLSVAYSRVRILPEDRADIAVEAPAPFKAVRAGADVTVTDGTPPPRRFISSSCPGVRYDGPLITVHAPRILEVVVDRGVIVGSVGPMRSLQLSDRCGGWFLGPTTDVLNISTSERSVVRAADARQAMVRVEGPGRVSLGHVSDGLDVYLDGDGQVSAAGVDGRLDVELWGAGAARIGGGITRQAYLFAKGRGQILHGGTVATLTAEARGKSLVQVGMVTGLVSGLERDDAKIRYARPANRRYCVGATCS